MIPIRDDTPRFSTPYVTYFIIALNGLVFLFELLLDAQSRHALNGFIYEFGIIPSRFETALTGQSHLSLPGLSLTIFTSMFVHGGIAHLAFNMLFFWIFGDNIEDYLGHSVYLLFYLLSGAAAAVTHILLNPSSRVPTVGASGAIAGVMGAYLVLYPKARVLTWFPPIFLFFLPAWLFLGYWFVGQFLMGTATAIAETSQSGGVAFWAHVGGFVTGVILIKILPERPRRYRYAAW